MRELGKGLYVLDESGEKPVRCDDIEAWANWFEDFTLRQVNVTFFDGGKIFVSTVFLGVDHGVSSQPILWETMVFRVANNNRPHSINYDRCAGNREQALAMHASMCARVDALLSLGVELKA